MTWYKNSCHGSWKFFLMKPKSFTKMEDSVREEGKSHESSNQEKVIAEVEDVIMSEVEKLESSLGDEANIDQSTKWHAKRLIDEVKMIVEKLRDMKLEEKSKLKYLISNVIEDVGDAHRLIEVVNYIKINHRLFSMSKELETINERFHLILLQNDGIGDGDGDGDVVGLEEDVEFLLHKTESIICIKGYDGFGKTTLARQLYNHADVAKKFKRRAWVNCYNILGRKELLINIIQQVACTQPKDVEEMDEQGLQNMLRQQLQGKQYFIVLDDIWRVSYLYIVKQSLPLEDKESKLLVTHAGDKNWQFFRLVDFTYEIRALDESKSWKLLLKTIFSGNNTCVHEFPKQLEKKGKKMLMKHTDGVPLAIKDVGMEWAEKRRLGSEWEEVIDSPDLKLGASLRALESSFYPSLDPDDKSVFLHIGLFKQGCIKQPKFEQTWFASCGKPLSEIQRDGPIAGYLFHMVRIDKFAISPRTKYYQVGAIFHKLAIKKAKEGNNGASGRVIYCSRESVNCPTDQDERLVSLFFNGGGCFDASPSYWKCFEQLRVLDFEGFGLKFVPETVGDLIELRYLGLRNNYIQQLPHSLRYLKNLEVLDIALNFMVEVPDIIWEMDALVHLYMSDIFCRNPLKIEALKKLRTLTYISVDNWTYEVSGLRMMTRLRKLGIEELNENSSMSKLCASLAAFENLECLVLRGSRFRRMPPLDKLGALVLLRELNLYGLITMLPKAEDLPPFLHKVSLVNSYFDEDPMPVLEKLSALQYLKLQNAYTGRQMVISEGGFPKLNYLCIKELWHLRNIQVGRDAFCYLTTLEITSCPCLQSLPEEMRSTLQVEMVTTKNIATKVKKSDLFSKLNYKVDIYIER